MEEKALLDDALSCGGGIEQGFSRPGLSSTLRGILSG
jgi:hypothetical protein